VKIYLAAPYAEMPKMKGWSQILTLAGHQCTSRWVHGDEVGQGLGAAAQMDLDDIDAADAVVSATLPHGTSFKSGGRHVEFGYGLAKNKVMIIVNGGCENVFHHLPKVVECSTIEAVIAYLRENPLVLS
jgi:hypothetical protein